MTDPSPLKPKKSGRVGPAPTVISSNLKTMRKVKAADAEAAPETPSGPAKKYRVKAKPEKVLSATEKMRARAEAEERQKGQRLTDLSVKEQSYVAATLGKLLKKISRPRVRLVHPKAIEMCNALGLGQWHLRILKEKFEEIDVDNSGNIDPEEFFESMDEQEKGDSTSLQRECSARARSGNSTHASRPFREMIARPKISRNEWKTAEI